MSFRNIRPSSTNAPAQSSESTSSDAKKVQSESTSSSSSKRRRVPESVTRNACVNCKKARAKCDGKKPCGRCANRVETSPCVYEVHIKHAKEELVKQIKELETKNNLTKQILRALSNDQHVPEILHRLQNGESYESIVEWLAPSDGYDVHSPTGSQNSTFEALNHEMAGVSPNILWTSVTTDPVILDHLFQLYFAWVHPFHTLFSEGHFVNSFRYNSKLFCSPVLVNAICALACHLHANADTDEIEQLGQNFSDAVRSEMEPDDGCLTTIQALAVMFLVDCGRGRGLRASSYLTLASRSLSKIKMSQEDSFREVLRDTMRGIRSLNVEWAQMTFQIPTALREDLPHTVDIVDDEMDEAKWYFYRFVNDQCPAWSGLVATTNREMAKLMDISKDVTTMLYNPSGPPIQASQILQQYARYLSWRERLPKSIGDIENNNSQALPHVLSLLILYSSSVVQLLRPLLGQKGLKTAGLDEIIWQHAQTGLFLLDQHYRTQYTCRYQPVFQMFAILHLCDVIARFFPGKVSASTKDGPEAIQFGMEGLMQSYAGFPIAGAFQELLKRTALACSVPLPTNWIDLMTPSRPPRPVYRADDFIDACTRLSYSQPIADIERRLEPSFSINWDAQSPSRGFADYGKKGLRRTDDEEQAAQHLMLISKLLNDD